MSYLLPAVQGSVHGVDGVLADVEEHWVHKHVHVQGVVLGAAAGCGLALETQAGNIRNELFN